MMAGSPTRWREAHAHLFEHGRAMSFVKLDGCATLDAALSTLAEAAATTPAGEWLIAIGARPESWPERRWPTQAELCRAIGDVPACVWCFDYHALLTNDAGLKAARFTDNDLHAFDQHGFIEQRDGVFTGVLLEGAAGYLWDRIEPPKGDARRRVLRAAIDDLASGGCVELHDLKSQRWLGPELAALDDESPLPMRIVLYPLVEDLEAVVESAPSWRRGRITIGGGKLFSDGTLNSRTAWMLEPYADPPPEHPEGLKIADEASIEDAIRRCDALGLPMATHAIGDGAVRAVLDAIERVEPKAAGFRIEHGELIDGADVPRLAGLGVTWSPQPCHLLTDIEVLERTLPHRLERVLPLREAIDAGLTPGESLIFGSDTPIVRPDPADSIVAATRRGREGGARIAPAQAITEAEAWACFAPTGEHF